MPILRAASMRLSHSRTVLRCHGTRTMASGASKEPLKRTGLYDFHVQKGAKMVPFAGYSMPLTYGDVGQVSSHNHVRNHVGLFDVGHMVQTIFRGPSTTSFLEHLTPSSLSSLSPYASTLSVLLTPSGTILDDTVITKHSTDAFYVVTNAGRRAEDIAHFNAQLDEWNATEGQGKGKEVEMEVLLGWGLVALQGPEAAKCLQALTSFDLGSLVFGRSAFVPIDGGFNLHVARGGYTGEDGFEISIPPQHTVSVTSLLTKFPNVQLTGLAARDSLRLEAGMCLYGQDLDETTTPVEAGLSWVIGKDRRTPETASYIGASTILDQLKNGPKRRRVGIIVEGVPARQHAKIYAPTTSNLLGAITSGIPSPTLGANIAMGYVQSGWHKKGTELEVEVRGQRRAGKVVGMPFVPTKYYRGS